ncbi:MAG: hypothetical protein ACTSU6_02555 [Candidatus Njordarchaeales archaeon]
MKYLSLILLLSACAKSKDPRKNTTSNQDFIPYIQEFESYLGYQIQDIPINFMDLDTHVGVCRSYSRGYREIHVDPTYWAKISEKQRINLIFHELGHCSLNLDHDYQILGDGCPNSFMYKSISDNFCLDKYYDHYIEEMFF